MNDDRKYFGKYRGTVTNNVDPEQRGRVQVSVPDVSGDNTATWALPCVPYAGKGVGLFLIPPTDALVWVEYEQGDTDYPIWTGCFWGEGDAPASPALAFKKVLKTDVGTLTLDDTPGSGGITLETTAGLKLAMDTQGIELSFGSSKVTLSASGVSVNDGALEVI
jgi:uncharacterized protein involved in type VI secretion and phage assembly